MRIKFDPSGVIYGVKAKARQKLNKNIFIKNTYFFNFLIDFMLSTYILPK